ncbi:MAG: ABC transporter ATP-binding protein [Caldisericia bacterium]|nr:ABC transporter ATP-binding protein [Caldisericia bacterium]
MDSILDKKDLLVIENLHVEVEGKEVLKGVDLTIKEGETAILFGPNGSGKTTLLMSIMGFNGYNITEGRIIFKGTELNGLPPYERARMGIGVAFQKPPKIKGVKLKSILDIVSKNKDYEDFIDILNLSEHVDRDVNVGFSGGEMKRSEILQLLAQSPDLVLLDEPESGVDLENVKILGKVISILLEKHKLIKERKRSGLIITHTGYILDYVEADRGYIMLNGKIICEANPHEILKTIQKSGFKECEKCKRI